MKNQSGQTLLIAIMLLATALTIVLAVSFRSTTETNLTKLEEEHQKALAAAEAGIEAALQNGSANIGALNVPSGFTGSASSTSTTQPIFVSPLLQKDEEYTFYLSSPCGASPCGSTDNPTFTTLTPAYKNLNLTVCFGSSSVASALDITLLQQNGVMKKYAVNPISPAATIINGSNVATASSPNPGDCPANTAPFSNKYTIPAADIGTTSLVLIVRVISPSSVSTYLGFQSQTGNLPLQGRTIVSSAQSPSGVSTTVQLFQSYPQIPSDFFVTSF